MSSKIAPAFADVLAAAERIGPFIHRTPVLTCRTLDGLAGARLYFKAENLQKAGAFKFRGAMNAVRLLSDSEAARGVAAHSSGNHAAALALSAKLRGVPAFVVMPRDAPAAKIAAVEGYGGEVTLCEPTAQAREEALRRVVKDTGAMEVHAYDDPHVIAGAATAALELLKEVPELDAVIAPCGGGGLLSGTAVAAHGLSPETQIFGAEPEAADDAFHSLAEGKLFPPKPAVTVADGLRMALSPLTFGILRQEVDAILRVGERDLLAAMRLLWERAKTVVEPSGAAGLAAVLRERERFEGRSVGIILSGGNVELTRAKLVQYF